MKKRVLIVDDEQAIRESLAGALADATTEVCLAANAEEAWQQLSREPFDLALVDVRMAGQSGLELLSQIRGRRIRTDVVLMTAFDDMPTIASAMRDGAADFLVKPLDLHDLRRVMTSLFEDRQTRESAAPLPESHDDARLVGRDPRMIAVYKIIGQVASTKTTVLIRGESGTGKELVAQAIHQQSASAHGPFVAVNCAALPTALLESELFGHARGAFTGAQTLRRGRFATAGSGTIFLDEIGDTTPDFQIKLLRVLQEGEFQPLGSEAAERTDARVIAATHRDLEQMVADGSFREDLYYRLRVVEIRVPPLRERRADLPLLIAHLLRRAGAALGRSAPVLSPEAATALEQHSWPGNVRELENCLRRAVVLATADVIRPDHLGLALGNGLTPPAGPTNLADLAEVERAYVERVIAATGGHKTRTAEILGISRPRLNRILKQSGPR